MALNFSSKFKNLFSVTKGMATSALEFLGIPAPKAMEFRVGEGLTEEQAIKAKEVIAQQVAPPLAPEPRITAEQAFTIVSRLGIPGEAEKIPKELVQEAIGEAGIQVMGFAFPVGGKKLPADEIKDYLKNKVSTSLEKAPFSIKGVTQQIYNKFSQFYTATVDRFNPIVNITKQAAKTGEIPMGENPELLSRRYLGIKGISESKLFWKTTELTPEGNLKITGEGLSKILEPARNNLDDLRALMVAQRDLELVERGITKGATPEQSQRIINILKTKPNFSVIQNTAQGVRDYAKRAILDPLKEVGAISDDVYNKILQSNKFYTPYKRVMEEIETQGVVPKGTNIFTPKALPIKPIRGAERKIIDPLESLITDTYKVTDFVERARVAKAVINLGKIPEMEGMIEKVSPKFVPVAKEAGETIFRPSFFAPEKNTIMVFENGKRVWYKVSEDLAKAMEGMSTGSFGIIQKILSLPAKTLRVGATLTLEFIGRNPVRDQFTAMVFSKYGYIPGVDLVNGFWNTIGRTDLYQRWFAAGGAQSMFVSLDRVSGQRTLQEVAGKKLGVFSPQMALIKLKGLIKEPLSPLRMLSEFGEKGTRIGGFRKALKKGASDLEAMFESRDLTLDFSRIGSQTKIVNQIIAFFNANVQGIDKLARSFTERPVQTSLKALAGITIPSVSLYFINRNNPRYLELPQWQKDLFWIIIPPGDKSPIIRIPKPFELGIIFGTVPERVLAWIDENDPEALQGILSAVGRGASPGYIPNIMLPWLENLSNYSFFRDRPILSQSIENLPAELQANTYTSETAKQIGKLIKYSPAKIENLVNGYFAGLGRYALSTSDEILKGLGIVSPPPEPEKTLADIPFIRAFIAREPIGSASESVNRFYKILEETTQAKNAAKRMADSGDIDGSAKYMQEHKEVFFFTGLNGIAQDFSNMRKQKDIIFNSKDISPREKRRAIDEIDNLMTEIAKQVLIILKENE